MQFKGWARHVTSLPWRRLPFAALVIVASLIPVWLFDFSIFSASPTDDGSSGTPARAAVMPDRLGGPLRSELRVDLLDPRQNRASVDRVLTVGKGDTLISLLTEAGVPLSEAHGAVNALAKVHNPRTMRPGEKITVSFEANMQGTGPATFSGLTLRIDPANEFAVLGSTAAGYKAYEVSRTLVRSRARGGGTIDTSLYDAALGTDVPLAVLMDLVRVYSWDVDFQRDIQPGDNFEILFERFATEDGQSVREGPILFANLVLQGKAHMLYRHTTKDGLTDYFNEDGQSARKALLRTPIDGARLSSRYGKRRHPILGYTKMHRGVDFAAPRGTPIYAAGNGSVESRGPNGAYGNYIRVRHNSEYATAYAHLSRFANGVSKGSRVKQGQIIGYVGTTGRSTGPHLHFEILVKGQQTNPMKVRMPSGRKLAGRELAVFEKQRAEIERAFAELPVPHKVASGK
jgi:murein DD-endopeptidase MepM/ murein hydrolase activator NlpD